MSPRAAYVSAQLRFHYDRRQIILEGNKTSEELAGKYVDLYGYTDGTLGIRWKGISRPYRVFAKDKRVSQTAVVENKRLGHALAIFKTQQDRKREVKVLNNGEKDGKRRGGVRCMGQVTSKQVTRLPWLVKG